MDTQPHRRGLLLPTAVVLTGVLAAVSFATSFAAQADYAEATGVATGVLSWGWPIAVDGLVLVAGLLAVALRQRGLRAGGASAASAGAFVVSVLINVGHALGEPPELAAPLMAAVPPVALGVAGHLLLSALRHGVATPVATRDMADDTPASPVATPAEPVATAVAADDTEDAPCDTPATPTRERVAELARANPGATPTELAALAGVSARTVQRHLSAVRGVAA